MHHCCDVDGQLDLLTKTHNVELNTMYCDNTMTHTIVGTHTSNDIHAYLCIISCKYNVTTNIYIYKKKDDG